MIAINGNTQLLGILGDPVRHSLSPAMQNAALAAAGMDAVYLPLHVRPDRLESAVTAIRIFSMIGVNVTVPHKQAIIPYLDELDAEAALIGAVNTVVNRQGVLIGMNTDAPGFLASLRQDLRLEPHGKKVIVLGAGGACRAALTALAASGAKQIVVANRTRDKAERMVTELGEHFPTVEMIPQEMTETALSAALQQADLLVNTTTIGLTGEAFPAFYIDSLSAAARVYDMVYTKGGTPLVNAARQQNLVCADGRGMLVAQGEEAFFRWFGIRPAAGVMRSQVIEK